MSWEESHFAGGVLLHASDDSPPFFRATGALRYRFLRPVPEAPGRFELFRAPLDLRPDVVCLDRGAVVFDPLPRPPPFGDRAGPVGTVARSTSPLLSDVVRVRPRVAVPRERPPRPARPVIVSSCARRCASRRFGLRRPALLLWTRLPLRAIRHLQGGCRKLRASRPPHCISGVSGRGPRRVRAAGKGGNDHRLVWVFDPLGWLHPEAPRPGARREAVSFRDECPRGVGGVPARRAPAGTPPSTLSPYRPMLGSIQTGVPECRKPSLSGVVLVV